MRPFLYFLVLVGLIFTSVSIARASDFTDGLAAFKAENYETAKPLLTKAADQGSADAQFILGLMYNNGLGVPKDYKKAYMWISLAINDETEGGEEVIDRVKENLSFEDLLEAQDMARRCRNSGYKDC